MTVRMPYQLFINGEFVDSSNGRTFDCKRVKCLANNTTQCPRLGLKPRPLAPGTRALKMRPPHLQLQGQAPGQTDQL